MTKVNNKQLRIVNIDESNTTDVHNKDYITDNENFVVTRQVDMFYPNIIENTHNQTNLNTNEKFIKNVKSKVFYEEIENSYYLENDNGNNFRKTTTNRKVQRGESSLSGNALMFQQQEHENDFNKPYKRLGSVNLANNKYNSGGNQLYDKFPLDKSPIRGNTQKKFNYMFSGKSSNINVNNFEINQNLNTTLLNLVNNIQDPNKTYLNQLQNANNDKDGGNSIYLPLNTIDLDEELKLAEAGYMEEDDEDLKSSGMSGGFFGMEDDDEEKFFNKDKLDNSNIENNLNKSKDKSIDFINHSSLETKKMMLNTKEELEAILFPKSQFDVNINKTFIIKTTILNNGVEVIDPDLLIIILNFLYLELHNGLIELGDNFLEERRKYFHSNFDTYLSIVNFYLKSKEEFFLGVLSQIMSKLSISQSLLDSSFNYYMNEAEENEKIEEIKINYEKVYRAGEKYSIAPKVITKLRLKNILLFQLETYQSLINQYPDYNNDVLEIIVTDTVYSEFGFDKEAIRAAIQKHEIHNDKSFDEIIYKLEEFRNTSFLN